jgi:F0F1-type ATP synthase assembly protein I
VLCAEDDRAGSSLVAHLSPLVELTNWDTEAVTGSAIVLLPDLNASCIISPMTLAAGDTVTVSFSNNSCASLNLPNPQLWWPWQMGESVMQNITFSFLPLINSREQPHSSPHVAMTEGFVPELLQTRFGIRQISSELIQLVWALSPVMSSLSVVITSCSSSGLFAFLQKPDNAGADGHHSDTLYARVFSVRPFSLQRFL